MPGTFRIAESTIKLEATAKPTLIKYSNSFKYYWNYSNNIFVSLLDKNIITIKRNIDIIVDHQNAFTITLGEKKNTNIDANKL